MELSGILKKLAMLSLFLLGVGLIYQHSAHAVEAAIVIPPPAVDEPIPATAGTETAVFGGGCFWGVQGVFQHVAGVTQVVSGYSGGASNTAHYEMVSTGTTGHAESVQVTYDPRQVSYGKLLQIFFSVAHNPTELNRQGPDSGTQYRSVIFPQNAEQQQVAQNYIGQLDKTGIFGEPIVTKIEPFQGFYPAEAHHQNFLTLNPDYPYILINDIPKVQHLKQVFPTLYHEKPTLVNADVN